MESSYYREMEYLGLEPEPATATSRTSPLLQDLEDAFAAWIEENDRPEYTSDADFPWHEFPKFAANYLTKEWSKKERR